MSDEKLLTGPAGKELTIDGAIAPVVVAEEHLPHEAKRFLRIGMLILLVLVGGFFAWAALAPLDAGVPAAGVTIVESKRKTVAHLTGGIVKEILVRDMQFVHAGDPLVVLDETTASAQYESANVPQVAQVQCRRDYYQIDWAPITRANETGVYCESVLKVYAPFALGMITNIADG